MNTILIVAALLSEPFTVERVVAVVGEEPVLNSEVVALMIENGLDEESAAATDWSSDSYQEAMEQVIQEKLLVEAARREGLFPSSEEVQRAADASMEQARSGFRSEQEFLNYLASIGMSVRTLRASYESVLEGRIAGENYVRSRAARIMASMPIDPVGFFTENPDIVDEVLAPRVLSWIYIPVLPINTGEAEEFLSDLKEQILSGETTFSAAASTYSQDGSASSGGDLGWFHRGDMTATFEQQVYSLQPGEIAGPFTTPFGVHLVKLTDMDGDSVRASHILRIVQPSDADVDSALALAERTVLELDAGADFARTASAVSVDPISSQNGGFLGTVNVGNWDGELRRAVIDLQPEEISRPVIIEQSMAIAIFKRMNGDEPDWNQFTPEELDLMLQSVFWNISYDRMVDSLRTSIPVLVNVQNED